LVNNDFSAAGAPRAVSLAEMVLTPGEWLGGEDFLLLLFSAI